MIESRRKFLTCFFAALDAHSVSYCVQRNYANLYLDASTDLDLIVSPYSLNRFEQCLRESAEHSGFHLVQMARYVNYSHVFWHPVGGFVRVDFETDVRWRQFTVLAAREVLDARRRCQEFFIPHPAHESVILYVAALWRGELIPRYQRQLDVLHAACTDKSFLRKTLIGAFGPAGDALGLRSVAVNEAEDRRFWKRFRLRLIFRSQLPGPRLRAVVRNLWFDACRLIDRVLHCAGVSLVFVSSHPHSSAISDLQRELEFLFPSQKCLFQNIDLRAPSTAPNRMGGWGRWQRLRTLFKGGLFLRAYRVAQDRNSASVLQLHRRHSYSRRSFVCVEDARGEFYFAHVQSGIMNVKEPSTNAGRPRDFSRLFIEFIANVLEREQRSKRNATQRPGKFCVLVGLDGAGKTTLARNLAGLGTRERSLAGVRYFHWLPGWRKSFTCPWPEPGNQPRKPRLPGGVVQSLLSVARLLRNLLRAQLAWRWRLRPMRNHGYLLLVDRYFYNYYLDPVSVKYYGPRWVLDRLSRWFPKPDIVITLSAAPEVLLQRKQEVSEMEMREQAATLRQLKFPTPHVIAADASEPAGVVADKVMAQLRKLLS